MYFSKKKNTYDFTWYVGEESDVLFCCISLFCLVYFNTVWVNVLVLFYFSNLKCPYVHMILNVHINYFILLSVL